MDDQKRSKNKRNNSRINWWKWAFLGLIAIIIIVSIQLMSSIETVSINEPNMDTVAYTNQEMVFTTSATREDTEQFINTFLSTTLDEEYDNFSVEIQDQLNVHGQLEVFQFTVPFTLSFDPYVLYNGNVLLLADDIELVNLSLSVRSSIYILD